MATATISPVREREFPAKSNWRCLLTKVRSCFEENPAVGRTAQVILTPFHTWPAAPWKFFNPAGFRHCVGNHKIGIAGRRKSAIDFDLDKTVTNGLRPSGARFVA
jgi:hypothetical protein